MIDTAMVMEDRGKPALAMGSWVGVGSCGSYGDDSEVDVLGVQGVGAGALQDAEVRVVLFDRLVDAAHGLHRLHPTGHHHGTP